jgi:hypothetical protein
LLEDATMNETSVARVTINGEGALRRRDFLRSVGLGGVGLSFTDWMAVHADVLRQRRMACILLWMAGGPSQFETFDPKPEHANGGETEVIETVVPGVQIARGWEKTAAVMNRIALVRSMTNKEGNHARASYHLHTGYLPTGTLKHPNFGCNVAAELCDTAFDLPHMVSIGGPTVGAGFLGVSYEPFQVTSAERPPTNVALQVPSTRFDRRLRLLGALENAGFERRGGYDRVQEHKALYAQTAALVKSPRMEAFDISKEESTLRDAYGRTPFGQGCLLARRLVEAGVTFVEVQSRGWDTHDNGKDRIGTLASAVDPGFATLVTDLQQRGLLDSTLVVWMGEFGRTPRVNPRAGRDHFPRAFSMAMAGAGVRGGSVIGATSKDGTDVTDRPVTVPDLLASFCSALKIDAGKENMTSVGRPMKIVDGGEAVHELFA